MSGTSVYKKESGEARFFAISKALSARPPLSSALLPVSCQLDYLRCSYMAVVGLMFVTMETSSFLWMLYHSLECALITAVNLN